MLSPLLAHAQSSRATQRSYQRFRDTQKSFHLLIERAGSPGKLGLGVSVSHITRDTTRANRPANRLVGRPVDHVIGERWRTRARIGCARWKSCGRSCGKRVRNCQPWADCAGNLEIAEMATCCSEWISSIGDKHVSDHPKGYIPCGFYDTIWPA